MRPPTTIRPRGLRLSLLLAAVLSLPASTTALSIAASDMDLDPAAPRASDGPATPSIWETPAPIQVRPVAPKPAPPPRPLGANPLWAIPLATLSNTRERPIFSPSRRPPPTQMPVAVAAPPAPPPPPPRVERPPLVLVGTVAGNDESFGIFLDKANSTALRLRVGEDYQGWRLRVVQGRDVSLERDHQTVVLSLPEPGTEAAAGAAMGGMPIVPAAPPIMPPGAAVMPTANSAMSGTSTADEEQAHSPPRRRR
jgi:general secretion pathway protein N